MTITSSLMALHDIIVHSGALHYARSLLLPFTFALAATNFQDVSFLFSSALFTFQSTGSLLLFVNKVAFLDGRLCVDVLTTVRML